MDSRMKCYCISLVENSKERDVCQREFDKIGLEVEFEIVERSPEGGSYGCFMSHLEVLNKGLKTNSEYIMIMEDDVYFYHTDSTIFDKIYKFMDSIRKDEYVRLELDKLKWCLCLGYFTNSHSISVNKHIVALDKCYCSHAYIVPRHTAEKLAQMEWKNLPYDIEWHNVIDLFYAPYPMIAFQRSHVSTVSSGLGSYMINIIGFQNIARICELRTWIP